MTSRYILIGILALTAVVYLPGVFLHDFVSMDDLLLIVQNDKVHGLNLRNIFQVFSSYDPELYVPLTLLTYQMEFTIAGLHPFLYHLDNLLLHLGNIALVFGIVRMITKNDALALFSAGLFAVHPLQTEAVSWASARKDLLSGFLCMFSLWMFLRYRMSGLRSTYHWSLVLYTLALGAKVSVILLPFSIMVLDGLQGDFHYKKSLKEFSPFGIVALTFGVIALFGKTMQLRELNPGEHLLVALKSLAFTIKTFLMPVNLTISQPQMTPVTLLSPDFMLSLVVVIALTVIMLFLRKRMPLFTFGCIFAFLAIAPSFMNFWKKDMLYFASDRYAYLSVVGLALSSGMVLRSASYRLKAHFQCMILVGVFALLGSMAFAQAQTWRDSTALYTHTLRIHPGFAPALNNLGASVYSSGDTERAMELYRQAIASDPTLISAYSNLALYYRIKGNITAAIAMVQSGLEHIPEGRPAFEEEIAAWSIFGSLLDELGMREEALTAYRKAVERGPDSVDAHYNLGVTAQKYGLLSEAREQLTLYLKTQPRDLEARYHLASIEAETGDLRKAKKNLEIIVAKDPTYAKAAEHLRKIEEMIRE